MGLLVLDGRQYHQGRHHRRPGGNGPHRNSRRADHECAAGNHCPQAGGLHVAPVACAVSPRCRRGESPGHGNLHAQLRWMDGQRRPVDHARTGDAGADLVGNQGPRAGQVLRDVAAAQVAAGALSRRCRAGRAGAGRRAVGRCRRGAEAEFLVGFQDRGAAQKPLLRTRSPRPPRAATRPGCNWNTRGRSLRRR